MSNEHIKEQVKQYITEFDDNAYQYFLFKNREFWLPCSAKALDRLSVTRPNYLSLKK